MLVDSTCPHGAGRNPFTLKCDEDLGTEHLNTATVAAAALSQRLQLTLPLAVSSKIMASMGPNSPHEVSPACASSSLTASGAADDMMPWSLRTEISLLDDPTRCSPARIGHAFAVNSWGLSSNRSVVRVARKFGKRGKVCITKARSALSIRCWAAASGGAMAGNSLAGGSRKAD